jgi:ring-1,2-phenylacetyl-CoA epoxidase subunit PaaC
MNDVLALADDKLMLGHVQSDWTGLGPILEEDIAASAMAQDDLSHALVLYEFLQKSDAPDDADELAFGRDVADYRCCDLMTLPDDFDWAVATSRRFLFAHFAAILLHDFAAGNDGELADRATRLQGEQAIQTTHLNAWMVRLGTGGGDAHTRMQCALNTLAPHAGMLFEDIEDRDDRFARWQAAIAPSLAEAGLSCNVELPDASVQGGRRGQHAPHFIEQHAEMTQVRAAEPGAAW